MILMQTIEILQAQQKRPKLIKQTLGMDEISDDLDVPIQNSKEHMESRHCDEFTIAW